MQLMTWFYFALACVGLSLTPGPNSLLVMTNSVNFGVRKTLYTIAGGVSTFLLLMALSMFGIHALISAWPAFLDYVRWVGGGYLIYLGIQQWRTPIGYVAQSGAAPAARSTLTLFAQGVLAAGANPKVFLFFGAFLTPFIDPAGDMPTQFIVMAATFAMSELCVELIINLAAGRCRRYLRRSAKAFGAICGCLFILLGCGIILSR